MVCTYVRRQNNEQSPEHQDLLELHFSMQPVCCCDSYFNFIKIYSTEIEKNVNDIFASSNQPAISRFDSAIIET